MSKSNIMNMHVFVFLTHVYTTFDSQRKALSLRLSAHRVADAATSNISTALVARGPTKREGRSMVGQILLVLIQVWVECFSFGKGGGRGY